MKNAQEAYEETIKRLAHVDIEDEISLAEAKIDESINAQAFAAYIYPIIDLGKAEKLAIYLGEQGYSAAANNGNPIIIDGKSTPSYYVSASWKYLPANTRESYIKH